MFKVETLIQRPRVKRTCRKYNLEEMLAGVTDENVQPFIGVNSLAEIAEDVRASLLILLPA